MKSIHWKTGLGLSLALLLGVSVLAWRYLLIQTRDDKDASMVQGENSQSSTPSDRVLIGGVPRLPNEIETMSRSAPSSRVRLIKPQGFAPGLDPKLNPQVEGVAEALRTRKNPERFSSFVVPKTFDAKSFEERGREYAEEYSKVVEPGRVFASAQPGPGVEVIKNLSSRFHSVRQGESVMLKVQGTPNSPVTFTSFDLGHFENRLSSTTVVASEDGIAQAAFTAGGGTIDEIQIMAASPVTSGRVNFLVSVQVGG